MQRRSFLSALLATPAGLLLPYEPERVYSFIRRPIQKPTLRIYAGRRPANADAALLGNTLLSEIELDGSGLHFGGVDMAADGTGEVSFGRLYGPYGETILQMGERELGLDHNLIMTGASVAMQINLDPILGGMLEA